MDGATGEILPLMTLMLLMGHVRLHRPVILKLIHAPGKIQVETSLIGHVTVEGHPL